ncbi:MAG: hypothetical protein A2138_01065 [Deltaproteobacteria bacterium RBG_16_71_12]|nr:MAG: hypothetical protein A2138_01065 [Deltaproteobacteria bacterium RBG_16_71_12]
MTRRRPELPPAGGDPFADANADANRELLDGEGGRESRGAKKQRAQRLEKLGETLVALPAGKLARLELPDDLKAAVLEARRISAHGGFRRQIQFIGRIMRTVDARPIAAQLEALLQEDAPSSAAFRAAERWRDRLIAEGDVALAALVVERPEADRTALRQLMRQAVVEQAKQKPPHASRALFRALHQLLRA